MQGLLNAKNIRNIQRMHGLLNAEKYQKHITGLSCPKEIPEEKRI